MFVRCDPPIAGHGPILIEGVRGVNLGTRLGQIARDNAFPTMIIGLIATPTPDELAAAIATQYAGVRLHDRWYEASADLLAYIQHVAQGPIRELLARTHPGGLSEEGVDIEEMARILGVSIPTVRRLVKAGEIPCLRMGRALRFVPADVLAALNQRAR